MNKQQIQQRVLQNGKPLDLDKFEWDEKTRTFSTREADLVLDFAGIDNCTFGTYRSCTFYTGDNCTFKTAYDCTFKTGRHSTFDTGSNCTILSRDPVNELAELLEITKDEDWLALQALEKQVLSIFNSKFWVKIFNSKFWVKKNNNSKQ